MFMITFGDQTQEKGHDEGDAGAELDAHFWGGIRGDEGVVVGQRQQHGCEESAREVVVRVDDAPAARLEVDLTTSNSKIWRFPGCQMAMGSIMKGTT